MITIEFIGTETMSLREQTLGQLALSINGASAILRQYQLDYCCGGEQTLAQAASKQQLDIDALEAELSKLNQEAPELDWENMSLGHIIDGILTRYHDGHRAQLPNLIAQAEKVERVHAQKPTVPVGLAVLIRALSDELNVHMMKEERILFPMIKSGMGSNAHMPIQVMLQEHDVAGDMVHDILAITHNLTVPAEACTTWQVLYRDLNVFITELMDHINVENQVLFPRALAGE